MIGHNNLLYSRVTLLILGLGISSVGCFLIFQRIPYSNINFCRIPDPILLSKFVPNSTCKYKNSEFNIDYKINSQGLRDYDHTVKKPPDTFRILLLGDSFAEGYGLEINKSFGKIIESRLSKIAGQKIEVINAGLSGRGLLTEYLYLRFFGIHYEPDLTILVFNMTDFLETFQEHELLTEKGKQFLKNDNFISSPHLGLTNELFRLEDLGTNQQTNLTKEENIDPLNILRKIILITKNKTLSHFGNYKQLLAIPENQFGNIRIDPFALTRNFDIQEYEQASLEPKNDILRFQKLLHTNNSKFLMLLVPNGHMVNGKQWEVGRFVTWGFEKDKVYDNQAFLMMRVFMKSRNIDTVDLTPLLKVKSTNKKLFFDFDGHLNIEGNKTVGEFMSSFLQANYLY